MAGSNSSLTSLVCTAELAGEIGTIARFRSEASLALYLGMAALDNSSGKYRGSKALNRTGFAGGCLV